MYLSCTKYYSEYLGDSCNKNCENCFGGKDVVVAIDSFYATGETVLDKIYIEKGEWFCIISQSLKITRLAKPTDKNGSFWMQNDFFQKHFTHDLDYE